MDDEDRDDLVVQKPKRGRPRNVDQKLVFDALVKFKDRISPSGDGALVSKSDIVWKEIAREIHNVKTAAALYTYVSCNHDDVRRKVWLDFETKEVDFSDEPSADSDDNDAVRCLLEVSTFSCTADEDGGDFTFTIQVPADDFDKLVETRVVYLRKKQPRNVKRFLKGDWQHFINAKIWEKTRLKCGWNVKYHHLNTTCTSGVIKASCRCGSELDCLIERSEDGIVTINCSTTSAEGEKECGKRYIRGTTRAKLGEKLRGKSAHVVRAQMANEMMDDDDPEPPVLPTSPTMRTIKSQRRKDDFLHPDPLGALQILSTSEMKDEILFIAQKPFFVIYATKHQRTVYEKLTAQEHTSLAIDATGSIFSPFTRVDGTKTGPMFLYIAVLSTAAKSYTLAQMISESHSTGTIKIWLEQWIEQCGMTSPLEVVSDCSTALLGAIVNAFTRHKSVNEYADEYFADIQTVSSCYIRIDVAHTMKIFANLMRDVRSEIRRFYMVGVGKIVLCRNIEDAERLVRALLTISRSRNSGKTADGRVSACEKQKAFMQKVVTSNVLEDLGLDDDFDEQMGAENVTDLQSRAQPSQWRDWGKKIDASVLRDIECSPGEEVNAHWLPSFADRLIEKLKWLPLWSCIIRDRYGYGRCPASSAAVEAEFGTVKNLVLKGADVPMRPDEFVRIHKTYVDGRSKLKESEIEADRQRRACGKAHEEKDDSNNNYMSTIESDLIEVSGIDSLQNLADCSSVENSTSEIGCPACAIGEFPGGAHRCAICDGAVHALISCSLPVNGSEEGYGQKRVCLKCAEKSGTRRPQTVEHPENQAKLPPKKYPQRRRVEAIAPKMKPPPSAKTPLKDSEKQPANEEPAITAEPALPVPQPRRKYLESSFNSSLEIGCPACANGEIPGGAHRCAICDKAVHALTSCSLPVDGSEEGYGQKRVCLKCSEKAGTRRLRAAEHPGKQAKLPPKNYLLRNRVKARTPKTKSPPLAKSPLKDSEKQQADEEPAITADLAVPVLQPREKYLQSSFNSSSEIGCPACAIGEISSGAHRCVV